MHLNYFISIKLACGRLIFYLENDVYHFEKALGPVEPILTFLQTSYHTDLRDVVVAIMHSVAGEVHCQSLQQKSIIWLSSPNGNLFEYSTIVEDTYMLPSFTTNSNLNSSFRSLPELAESLSELISFSRLLFFTKLTL